MRFSTAWVKVAAQNVTLKVATVTLSIVALTQLVIISSISSRDPIVIERACFSRTLQPKASEPTSEEIKAFLNEALSMRFDSNSYFKDGFLSLEEATTREREQATLKQKQMEQQIIISGFVIDDKSVSVLADRLISSGKIKSALPLNLKIILQKTNRTESNPYGLILSSTTQIPEKVEK